MKNKQSYRPKTPIASIIIPSWNGKHMLGSCLMALMKQTYNNYEIIVVENGSTDGSIKYLESNFPHIIVLRQSKNLGFAGGVNVGLKYSRAKYKVLLNNDAVVNKNWLKSLINAAENEPMAFAVVSKILDANSVTGKHHRIDSTGDQYSIWGLPFPRGRGEKDSGRYDIAEEVFSACGGSVLYRASILSEIGLFDEDFFAYYEDVDISFRARLAGYKILYDPKSVVYHAIGATSGGGLKPLTRFHSVKNAYFLYIKNMPGALFWKYLPRFILSQTLVFISSIRNGLFLAHLKGLTWIILFTPKKIIQRYYIQRSRTLNPHQIDEMLYHGLPPNQKKTINRIFGNRRKSHE